MHLKRWLTAIIAIPILIYILGPWAPRWLFHALLFVVSVIGLWEFFRMAVPSLPFPVKFVMGVLTFLLFYFISHGPFFMILATFALSIILPMFIYLFFYSSQKDQAVENTGKCLFGFIYICLPLSFLIFVDKHPRGPMWILFLLCVIFLSDTGAFYTGRLLGKHKLYPTVSPKKTWEGAIGGLLISLSAAFIFSVLSPMIRFKPQLMILAAFLSIFGQIGDLAESMIKRTCGVKDSGKILPGHGGILDRIDGLLFSIPILFIYLTWSIP